jgi:hypothetical protein
MGYHPRCSTFFIHHHKQHFSIAQLQEQLKATHKQIPSSTATTNHQNISTSLQSQDLLDLQQASIKTNQTQNQK